MSYTQTIYNVFRRHGLTEAAALAFLGNWQCESGNEPFRLQGDFSPYRTASKAYVQGVTNGSISRDSFARDQKGFGLAQWTFYSRKFALYDYWKSIGYALDSAEMQTEFALMELLNDYKALFDFLKSTNDVFTACSRICREYERPAVNNIDARFQAANKIRYEIDLNAWQDGGGGDTPEPEPAPQPTPEPVKDDSLKLRTIDSHCESFDEYVLLRSILLCRGYTCLNIWDDVKEFQNRHGLTPDGIVGPMTWAKLLERG